MWIEELKTGKFKAVERYFDPLTGKNKKISIVIEKNTTQSRKAAQQALQLKIEAAIKKTETKEYTLGELIESYREYQKTSVRDSTYQRNYFACEAIKLMLGEDSLVNQLNARYIRNSLLQTGKEPGTLNEFLKRIKALLRWGYNNDLINDVSYLSKLENFKDVPHRKKIEDKYLESDELKIVLENMKIKRWYLIARVMALSGLRFGELIALNLSDLDFKSNIIRVNKTYSPTTKTVGIPKTLCSIREVYMQKELKEACKELRLFTLQQNLENGIKSELLICNPDGSFINFYSFNKYFKDITKKTLGKSLTSHSLRHTHASLLLENGVSIDSISRRLGHENSQVTKEIYLHVTEKLKSKDNEQIENIKII